MRTRIPFEPRASWRERFVEIARQVEGGKAPRALVVAAGLRLRATSSVFAVDRRARTA